MLIKSQLKIGYEKIHSTLFSGLSMFLVPELWSKI